MVGEYHPGVDRGPGRRRDGPQPAHERRPVLVIGDNARPLDSADHHVVQGAWRIQAGVSRHLEAVLLPGSGGAYRRYSG